MLNASYWNFRHPGHALIPGISFKASSKNSSLVMRCSSTFRLIMKSHSPNEAYKETHKLSGMLNLLYGAWYSQQHNMFIRDGSWGNGYYPWFSYLMALGISAGVSSLAYGTSGPTSWSFKCITGWDSSLVHPAKLVLLNILICCFNDPVFLLIDPASFRL